MRTPDLISVCGVHRSVKHALAGRTDSKEAIFLERSCKKETKPKPKWFVKAPREDWETFLV